jgi:hypothetical protein
MFSGASDDKEQTSIDERDGDNEHARIEEEKKMMVSREMSIRRATSGAEQSKAIRTAKGAKRAKGCLTGFRRRQRVR